MSTDEIRELILLLNETGIAELEVQRGDNRVRIRKSFGVDAAVAIPAAAPVVVAAAPAIAAPVIAAPAGAKPEAPPPMQAKSGPELVYVKSPIVGTFYESPSPDSPPFVRIGDHVTPGKVLCIIESMKLMNEIEAEVAGVIESTPVKNGQPVEYGEALFGIRPV